MPNVPNPIDLGSRIDPETGNFLAEDNAVEIINPKGKFINFHPYDAGWMQVPENETLYNEIRHEYESSPTGAKILAEVADATVEGLNYRAMMENFAGEGFYKLRAVTEDSISLVANLGKAIEEDNIVPAIGDGYHFHGGRAKGAVTQGFRDFLRNIDVAEKLKTDGENLVQYAAKDTVFDAADITELKQYATAIAVYIKPDAWRQKKEEPAGTKVDAFVKPEKMMIYLPEGTSEADVIDSLEHEYQHMVDLAILQVVSLGRFQGENFSSHYDDDLFRTKTEVAAYLNDPSAKQSDLDVCLDLIKAQLLKGGYERLTETDEKRQRFDQLFDSLHQSVPMILGLVEEAGLDPNDKRWQNTFLKTFVTMLPNREITYRSLEQVPETGLYKRWVPESNG